MPLDPHPLIALIDEAVELTTENGNRSHLGGSAIGKACERELYYNFRWAAKPKFEGRMLRLFERGHLEEFRFVKFLRLIGCEVREYAEELFYHPESDSYLTQPWRTLTTPPTDPEIDALCVSVTDDPVHVKRAEQRGVKLRQWSIIDVEGHFGGSLDGMVLNAPGYETDELLLEFKTHGDKSFKELIERGVQKAKPVHWSQMQIYMYKRRLIGALYFGVNKNTDHLHAEYVAYDDSGPELLEKARRVIYSATVPNRIGSGRPSHYECKFCDFKGVCHYGEPMLKSCRSCKSSRPVDDGQWHCTKWNAIIPKDAIPKGCDAYRMITD